MVNVLMEKKFVFKLFYIFIGIRWRRESYVNCDNGSFFVKKVVWLEWVSF